MKVPKIGSTYEYSHEGIDYEMVVEDIEYSRGRVCVVINYENESKMMVYGLAVFLDFINSVLVKEKENDF